MKRTTILAATVLALVVLTAGAGAATRLVITNIGQITPSVRAQLRSNQGPHVSTSPRGLPGVQGLPPALRAPPALSDKASAYGHGQLAPARNRGAGLR